MNDDERLDLSALDQERDPARWRATVERTLARVDALLDERARRQDPLTLIAGWSRPLLTGAAMAVAVLVPVELALERREAGAEQVERLVSLSTDWAVEGRRPSAEELVRVLGGEATP